MWIISQMPAHRVGIRHSQSLVTVKPEVSDMSHLRNSLEMALHWALTIKDLGHFKLLKFTCQHRHHQRCHCHNSYRSHKSEVQEESQDGCSKKIEIQWPRRDNFWKLIDMCVLKFEIIWFDYINLNAKMPFSLWMQSRRYILCQHTPVVLVVVTEGHISAGQRCTLCRHSSKIKT